MQGSGAAFFPKNIAGGVTATLNAFCGQWMGITTGVSRNGVGLVARTTYESPPPANFGVALSGYVQACLKRACLHGK